MKIISTRTNYLTVIGFCLIITVELFSFLKMKHLNKKKIVLYEFCNYPLEFLFFNVTFNANEYNEA